MKITLDFKFSFGFSSPLRETEWYKIFYFVKANTFSRKFRPKQQESDATKDVQTQLSDEHQINIQFEFRIKFILTKK